MYCTQFVLCVLQWHVLSLSDLDFCSCFYTVFSVTFHLFSYFLVQNLSGHQGYWLFPIQGRSICSCTWGCASFWSLYIVLDSRSFLGFLLCSFWRCAGRASEFTFIFDQTQDFYICALCTFIASSYFHCAVSSVSFCVISYFCHFSCNGGRWWLVA